MKYYVTMDADSVADELWGRDWEAGNNRRAGNTFGNNQPRKAPRAETAPADVSTEAVDNQDVTRAEGTGIEPATPYGAPHFQCGR